MSKFLQTQSEAKFLAVRDYDHKEYTDEGEYPTQEVGFGRENEAGSTILIPGQTLQGTGFKPMDRGNLATCFNIKDTIGHVPPISLTTEDVTRYKMAWRGLQFYQHLDIFPTHSVSTWSMESWSQYILDPFVQRCTDWSDVGSDSFQLPLRLGFTTSGLIYGGLHALAWFAHFGSSTQQLLWRISACMVMGGFPVYWVLVESFEISDRITWTYELDKKFEWFLLITVALVALAYMMARAYLVVECFINLSHLPAGVYDNPKWASYFPHIS